MSKQELYRELKALTNSTNITLSNGLKTNYQNAKIVDLIDALNFVKQNLQETESATLADKLFEDMFTIINSDNSATTLLKSEPLSKEIHTTLSNIITEAKGKGNVVYRGVSSNGKYSEFRTLSKKYLNNLFDYDFSIGENQDTSLKWTGSISAGYDNIEFSFKPKTNTNENISAEFFKYSVSDKMYLPNWARYGIYSDSIINSPETETIFNSKCLYVALENHNLLTEAELASIATFFKEIQQNHTVLREIVKELDIFVRVYYTAATRYNKETDKLEIVKRSDVFKYGNKEASRQFNIGLIDEHYFIVDELTDCSIMYVERFEQLSAIKDLPNLQYINRMDKGRKPVKRSDYKPITSTRLVMALLEIGVSNNNLVSLIDRNSEFMRKTSEKETFKIIKHLEYSKMDYKPSLTPEELLKKIENGRKKLGEPIILFLDTETYNRTYKNENNVFVTEYEAYNIVISRVSYSHKNYDFEIVETKNIVQRFENGKYESATDQLMYYLMNFADKTVIIYCHNLGFDIKMIMNHPRFHIESSFGKGTKNISTTGRLFGTNYFTGLRTKTKLIFKDSYALIASSLNKFPEMFKFTDCSGENTSYSKKHPICYDWYTNDWLNNEINNDYLTHSKTLKELYEIAKKSKQFNSNEADYLSWKKEFEEFNGYPNENTQFNLMSYMRDYCVQDVIILAKGVMTFRGYLLEISDDKIDILTDSLTISSYAKQLCVLKGCYDDTYDFTGRIQAFMTLAMAGGKCQLRNNEKQKIEQKIQLQDANSLYASAQVRIPGYIKGLPKVIRVLEDSSKTSESILATADYYFVEIKVLKVNKKIPMPLISICKLNEEIDEDEKNYTNDLEGLNIVVDKVVLEDLIEFQKIEYEFIRGYYFDEGFNDKIVSTTQELFDLRTEFKKAGNAIEQAYKAILTSIYGKNLEKSHDNNKVFIEGSKDFGVYFSKNTANISSFDIIKKYSYTNKKGELINKDKYVLTVRDNAKQHFNNIHHGIQILSMSKRIMNELINTAEDIGFEIFYIDTDSIKIKDSQTKLLGYVYKSKYERELYGKTLGTFHSDYKTFKGYEEGIADSSTMVGKKAYCDVVRYKSLDKSKPDKIDYKISMKGVPIAAIKNKYHIKNGVKVYMPIPEQFERLYQGKAIKYDLGNNGCFMEHKKNMTICHREKEFIRCVKF